MPRPTTPRRGFRIPARIYLRLGIYLVACWTMVGMLVSGAFPYALLVVAVVALYTILPLALFLRYGGFPFYPGRAFRLLVIRPFWYAQALLPLVLASGVIGLIAGAPSGHALDGARALAGFIAIAIVLLYVVGYLGASRLVIHEMEASLPTLPPEFDAVTIAQITDLHVGPHTSRRFLRCVVDAIRSLAPDIVAVTGDLLDDRHEDLAIYESHLGAITAPLGVFVIPGNHDVYSGWEAVERELRRGKLGQLLVNEAVTIRRDGATLNIVGTGDPAGGQMGAGSAAPDIARALSRVAPGAPVIALAHNPALWPALAARGVSLTLSGHTHWGQFAFPHLGWSLASPFLEYAMGMYQTGDALLYIAPGTGYWGIPFRIGAPSEVTLIRLRRGPAGIRDHGRRPITGAATGA